MDNTGRIREGLAPSARRILFGAAGQAAMKEELDLITEIDRAHVVMLVERRQIDRAAGRRLLEEISRLRRLAYAPLQGREAARGLYLCYESFLIETLGHDTGGMLHLARSRNDLNATLFRLKLRRAYVKVLSNTFRLQVRLLRRAEKFAQVVMPAYTHYQAAVPITFGHYLAGIAQALNRDIRGLLHAGDGMQRCPLGAGAGGGTSVPIDPARTAKLLGFEEPVLHSVDAVASRDIALRVLAAAAILATTLSRMAEDFLLWSTAEFGFLSFPDSLVGSSSMMPQKRNPFLLEHIQSRGTAALGAFVAAVTATQAAPFTNSIRVSGESVSSLGAALDKVSEAVHLSLLVVGGAHPNAAAMEARARTGFTSATELATRLALTGAGCFRSMHRQVGQAITRALECHETDFIARVSKAFADRLPDHLFENLDPAGVVRSCAYGGGAAPSSLRQCLQETGIELHSLRKTYRALPRTWDHAARTLERAVQECCLDPAPLMETGEESLAF